MHRKIITLDLFINEQEHRYPEATGALSSILYNLVLAGKVIWREVSKAGLVDILGATGNENIHGEIRQKLDVFANEAILKFTQRSGEICVLASEEETSFVDVTDTYPHATYVLLYDPLDGSSNIDVNAPIGTIFSIYKRISPPDTDNLLPDCLQPGIKQIAAGYLLYGSSTMLVYTTGAGTHGFTLDPSIGEFLLSHKNIQIPEKGSIYSFNEGNYHRWDKKIRSYLDHIKNPSDQKPYKSRYIGSLVADVHRTLCRGGIFGYPADSKNPQGKLRLLYEANPMALLIEQAGGKAINQEGARILEIQPVELHQRVPLFVGSKSNIEELNVGRKN